MARKKRLQEVNQLPDNTPKEPVIYEDAFQQKANERILDASRRFEGKGKPILYGIAAIAGLAILAALIYSWSNRSGSAGQTALGRAIETSNAIVTQQPVPPSFTGKVYKTEKERSEVAIAEFQKVAETYGGDVAEKAKYFAAVNKLSVDRNAAIGDLEAISKNSGDTGFLAKFALAQARQGDGKYDEALALYNDLVNSNNSIIAKDTINFEIASIYDKQGKKAEAANLYYTIAKAASERKDADGKAIPLSGTAREAKNKLESLDPAKAAEIKEEMPQLPLGM